MSCFGTKQAMENIQIKSVTKNKYFWLFDLLINKRVQRRRMQILLINFYANTKWQPKYTQILLFPNYDVQYWCLPANCGIFRICAKKAKLIIYVAGVSVCFDFSSEMLFFSFVAVANQFFFFFQYMIYRMLYAQHLFSRSNGDMPLKNEIKLVVSLFSVKIMMKNRMQWKIGPDLMMKKNIIQN